MDFAGALNSVHTHGERLNKCRLVKGNVLGDLVDPAALDAHNFGEPAATACQANKVHVL